jgi:hypothetical protein
VALTLIASSYAVASLPERVAMQMTGHKTRSVFERYHIVSGSDFCSAARKLDEAVQSNGTETISGTVKGRTAKAKRRRSPKGLWR